MARAKRGDTVSVTIDDLAFGGEGVGRVEGYVVFVPGGIPGDRLQVRLDQARARFGRGIIAGVESPSPYRVAAPCPYFGRCGGCRLQHVAYPAQLAFKSKQVADCLERLGGLGSFELRPIIGAPEIYGYRNKMEFTVARAAHRPSPHATTAGRAGDSPGARPLVIGLHEADRYDSVLDIERCLLQSDRMNTLLVEARRFFIEHGFSGYDQESGEGLLRFLMLREGKRTSETMVNVVTAAPAVSELEPLAGRLQARVPETTSVVMTVNPKKASVAIGVEEHLLAGRDHIRESLGGLTFQVSSGSFFQTNTAQAERLFELVLESACLEGPETVVDLYSGTGAISLLLARRCRWVYGIEVAPAAVADAVRNAEANGIANCTFLAGEVRFALPSLLAKGVAAEVVVADPPRAGFHPKALHALVTLRPSRLVYVSCNPATLARDVAELVRAGYRLEWVQPVDMFPHTSHIEVIARLSRGA
ncbi:MAG: 23S rRNA (uracil(1939)-C(5))-methyltransferase RlmD [Candidatus Rokubacteria bacterium]|nr:23S rRNA (uracil(1939)-C(5))-methyltransferase RlmD [Candidatus Rokubacteria bacterium]MBI2198687.1 23S rRNA (uracil(1939)-C(5))-methyltransferase RlmD [Candidatus Rokubacteria bacterium]MBI3106364.1 23S rRNA (uracil(1939)-C(5))-methyltransferase RlmD [Candidatus Rokubacteria bacterium]